MEQIGSRVELRSRARAIHGVSHDAGSQRLASSLAVGKRRRTAEMLSWPPSLETKWHDDPNLLPPLQPRTSACPL
jgi:hypothetical protein